jgi:small-conductance mechanosensitive channel
MRVTRSTAWRERARETALIVWCLVAVSALAPSGAAASQGAPETGVPVMYRGQEIVRIYRGVGNIGPAERARMATARLGQFVRDSSFDATRVTVRHGESFSEVVYDDRVLGVITDEDAQAVGRPRAEFAQQVRDRLVYVVTSTREEFSVWSIVIGAMWAALATGSLGAVLWVLARVRRRVRRRVDTWFQRLTVPAAEAAAGQTTALGSMAHGTVDVAVAAVAVAIAAVWVQIVLQVLPWSRPLARLIYRYASEPIGTLWFGFLGYVPNLFYLGVIALVTLLLVRVFHVVFREIEAGHLRFASFPSDWAEPTYKLVRALLLAVAFVGAFPYIPGSKTPAFQGISLFLGLLVSLSSSSALSNIIAGTILTYTRAFKVGDIVRIGDAFGEVTVKRLLATQVRTDKNVMVSIPNSLILTTQVLNYTTLAAGRGLVAHTSVTIGYDAPWRKVHELLIAAAMKTEGVLEDPPPFVLQTALNAVSITYEVNAFVRSPFPLPVTYSTLHANIQEGFNEAGVEMVSPGYLALRDGNQATTPRHHLPRDYVAPAFRLRDMSSSPGVGS